MLPTLNLKVGGERPSDKKTMAMRAFKMTVSKQLIAEAKVSGVPTTNLGNFVSRYSFDAKNDYVVISDKFSGRLYSMDTFKSLDSLILMNRLQIDGHQYDDGDTEIHIYIVG
jgi:hypothetical protein